MNLFYGSNALDAIDFLILMQIFLLAHASDSQTFLFKIKEIRSYS